MLLKLNQGLIIAFPRVIAIGGIGFTIASELGGFRFTSLSQPPLFLMGLRAARNAEFLNDCSLAPHPLPNLGGPGSWQALPGLGCPGPQNTIFWHLIWHQHLGH